MLDLNVGAKDIAWYRDVWAGLLSRVRTSLVTFQVAKRDTATYITNYLPPDTYSYWMNPCDVTPDQGMYHGDRSRKQTLVDYGFRLPSALDNGRFALRNSGLIIRIYISALGQ